MTCRAAHTHTPLSSRYVYARARGATFNVGQGGRAHAKRNDIHYARIRRSPAVCTHLAAYFQLFIIWLASGNCNDASVYRRGAYIPIYRFGFSRSSSLSLVCVPPRAFFASLHIYALLAFLALAWSSSLPDTFTLLRVVVVVPRLPLLLYSEPLDQPRSRSFLVWILLVTARSGCPCLTRGDIPLDLLGFFCAEVRADMLCKHLCVMDRLWSAGFITVALCEIIFVVFGIGKYL